MLSKIESLRSFEVPPTLRQLRYARRLGIQDADRRGRGELALLIDERVHERDLVLYGSVQRPRATEEQKSYARDLGIEFPEMISRLALSILIDEAKELRALDRLMKRRQQLESARGNHR